MASLGYSPISRPHQSSESEYFTAWLEYTGVPAAITGGLGAVGFNVASQASQVKTGTSLFSAARYGYGLALLLEASVGTMILATALTIIDPGHKIEGGLDESRFYLENIEAPITMAKAGFMASEKTLEKSWM
jgi:hypothetical protein